MAYSEKRRLVFKMDGKMKTIVDRLRGFDWQESLSSVCNDAADEIERLTDALRESVKLQAHYADLLNMHDGGHRIVFPNAEAWLARLQALAVAKENANP